MRATPSRKRRAAPSFEVLPPETAPERTGWVYRSDAEPPPAIAVEIAAAVVVPPLRRSVNGQPRPVTPPPVASRGWLETGFQLMTLPLTITFGVMRMPVNWLFGSRPR